MMLDPRRTWWVPAVVAPGRGWAGVPGSHKGSRYLARRDDVLPDARQLSGVRKPRRVPRMGDAASRRIALGAPGAVVRPVDLSRWLLGLD